MNYGKTRMGENYRKREEYHYNGDYNGVLWCARVSKFQCASPSMLEGILYLYRLCLFLIRLQSSVLFKHLTTYHRGS